MKNILFLFFISIMSLLSYSPMKSGEITAKGNLQREISQTITSDPVVVRDCNNNPVRTIAGTSTTQTKTIAIQNTGQTIRFVVTRKEETVVSIASFDYSINDINFCGCPTANPVDTMGSFSRVLSHASITPSRYNYVVKVYVLPDVSTVYSEREYTIPIGGGAFPIGSVIAYMGNSNTVASLEEAGWFKCDGRAISSLSAKLSLSERNALADVLGGASDIPDLRAVFLRGVDDGKNWDDDRTTRTGGEDHPLSGSGTGVRSVQGESMRNHRHSGTTSSDGSHTHTATSSSERWGGGSDDSGSGSNSAAENSGTHSHDITVNAAGTHSHTYTTSDAQTSSTGISPVAGNENRPDNIAVYWLIRGR
jgi:hypothetical protein